MKKIRSIVLITVCLAAGCSMYAQDYKTALGIRLSSSNPTLNNSFTGKYFLSNTNAVEALLSFGSGFGLGALYEIHQPLNYPKLQWFYGAGGFAGVRDHRTYLGPTGIVGLDYTFDHVPLNLSLDWKPELDILPKIGFTPDAFALSARFTLR